MMQSPSDIDITTLLPQRPPFVAVGRLVSCGHIDAVSETRVTDMPLFVESGCLTAAGMIENMAQTCAAWMGYNDLVEGVGQPKIGFIGGVSNCIIRRLPSVDDTLTTRITVEQEIFGMTLVSAEIAVSGDTVASASLKIALQK